jgi:hypothetical protein
MSHMTAIPSFRVNAPAVIREVFEDEAVLVHLESGNYYSLNETGAIVWKWVEAGLSRETLIARAQAAWDGDPAQIETAVSTLLDELLEERLVVLRDDDGAGGDLDAAVTSPVSRSFTPPMLSRYTDMQDLLLLDPIHDVDETGWPARAAKTDDRGPGDI